jgi:ferredoxin-NADP reductase/ferredoxin
MSDRYQVTPRTSDGEAVEFDCPASQSLLDAASDAGYQLPSICRSGSCGACAGHVGEGSIEPGQYSPETLTEQARSRGDALLCYSYPRSDLKVRVDQTLATITMPVLEARTARVRKLADVSSGVMLLQLEPSADGNCGANFEAGQYMELTLPDESTTRAYSIANTPNWEGVVEFYIRLQPEGLFSTWLQQAKVGEKLIAKGPSGAFTLDESGLSPHWFVAGGTGLSPVLSMLRWMGGMGAIQPTRLFFGVNNEQELFAEAEIDVLKTMLLGFKSETCLWTPHTERSGFSGPPTDALRRSLILTQEEGKQPDIHARGPPALIDGCEQIADELGLAAKKVHGERFTPS